ncbi:MAG: methylated-DNA--[protein]-cysteine S-methyltransferase [Thermotogaceae bacterium]|nr:methylated-DNA--[protein]-cysteine S-methyltransferase [Thermotogaceae bacterium]RKX42920.1 MAG: methylated-DNA--[protein]-cysteine S-methyltransferase [Thermotogota bacterium]
MEIGSVETKLGSIVVFVNEGKVVKIKFSAKHEDIPLEPFTTQIKGYLDGKIKKIDFPVLIGGGAIFKKIWKYVRQIPYGETLTYGEVARELGVIPKVVGYAMACNNLPLYIPCHRVVGKDGIGGFGSNVEWKEFLLEIESKT